MHRMIFGCGYSGKAIAAAWQDGSTRISGTTRTQENADRLAAAGIEGLLFDGTVLSDELQAAMQTVTHLVQSISPAREGDPLLRLMGGDWRRLLPSLQWIGYLSTIGVYGDRKGAWIDETADMTPVSNRSVERVDAENGWLALGEAAGIPVSVLRLSGIYGPGRNAFCNLEKGTARRLIKKDQVFNRIRAEDIGAATRFLAERNLGGIYNVTDHEPAPPQDIIAEAARLMGVAPPLEQPFETAELTPMARSFYGENKRVSNQRLRDLGFVFAYPQYRMSLKQLWESDTWRG